ncbi:MAG: tRNA1(Val) (adenine(37)-N6)-methyltransferase, partial [Chitinophagales bacterium]
MKVGTDGVLLGAWSAGDDKKVKRILDVGTGTGLIALMLAQRNSSAQIDAIEIDSQAAKQAKQNVINSPWANRVQVFQQDFSVFAQNPKHQKAYDVVVCNPPFFQNAYKTPKRSRNLARHNDTLSFVDLIQYTDLVLCSNGLFELILPSQEAQQFLVMANAHDFHCSHIMTTKAHLNKPPKRYLMRLCKRTSNSEQNQKCKENELLMGDGRGIPYTTAYKTLTQAFYLHF